MPYLLRKKFSWADLIGIAIAVQLADEYGLLVGFGFMLVAILLIVTLEEKYDE
jgi:hypothetical protein